MSTLFRLIQRLSAYATLLVAAPIILGVLGLVFLLSSFAAMMITGIIRQYYWGLRPFAGAATIGEWLLSIAVYGMTWLVAFRVFDMKTGFSSLFRRSHGDSHGSARFSTRKERAAFEGGDDLLIGRDLDTGKLLRYDGAAHLLTLAPTRAGKGVGTVIPNLLLAKRSVLVIDPKGENAKIAGEARTRFGAVHILDPFGVTGPPASAYNPLGRLSAESLDLGEDAASLSEALVMDPPGQQSDAHWNEEAKALLAGLIMFAVAHEDQDRKTLATVREYLTLPPEKFRALLELMQDSAAARGLIARAANRFLGKSDREAASVMSSAQRHTHFLDSPRIVAATARSDFQFSALRHDLTSIFLVLPPNRLDAYSRWLRLLVAQALQDIARDAEAAQAGATRLQQPALFLLDEFAALGRLEAVERAMGLMAGYGLQLWPILQDMSQLKDLYARGPIPSSPTRVCCNASA
jgi:type IV secretion system protein VirD4